MAPPAWHLRITENRNIPLTFLPFGVLVLAWVWVFETPTTSEPRFSPISTDFRVPPSTPECAEDKRESRRPRDPSQGRAKGPGTRAGTFFPRDSPLAPWCVPIDILFAERPGNRDFSARAFPAPAKRGKACARARARTLRSTSKREKDTARIKIAVGIRCCFFGDYWMQQQRQRRCIPDLML